jgi:hypothetical protein
VCVRPESQDPSPTPRVSINTAFKQVKVSPAAVTSSSYSTDLLYSLMSLPRSLMSVLCSLQGHGSPLIDRFPVRCDAESYRNKRWVRATRTVCERVPLAYCARGRVELVGCPRLPNLPLAYAPSTSTVERAGAPRANAHFPIHTNYVTLIGSAANSLEVSGDCVYCLAPAPSPKLPTHLLLPSTDTH